MSESMQIQDRHEHGGLPDTRSGETRRLIQGWKFWPSSEALASIHLSPDDHVTVTCHCARCEAERESPYLDGCPICQELLAERARDEADGRDQDGT